MFKHWPVLLLCLFSKLLVSQTFFLSGKVSGNREALPFANVYLKGTSKGVNSNDEGKYSLKLEKGRYTVIFQYVGYSKQEITIELTENKTLDVDLKPDGIALKEVVVKAGEDPAYPIMRKAIKKRKFYANQVEQYSCQSYIKGLQKLNNVPEKFRKLLKFTTGEKIDSTQFGVIYLSESESNYYFKKPNLHKEIMFSSRVSGESKSFSFNQLGQLLFNFYTNLVAIPGLSDRPFISPLNSNAFLYYKFILLGTINEDGKTFNKILVKPKRMNDPCFTGVIYIQENAWRLTSLDLKLTKDNKIKYVDTLDVKILFAPVAGDSVWMPVNHNSSFHFGLLGISANGYFNAIIKNYNLNPGLSDSFFSDETLVIEDGANKKDSSYWSQNRALPLTREENIDYRKKDSTEKLEDTDRYKDSVDRKTNRLRVASLFLGYDYHKTKKNISVSMPGLITSGVQYNTVEGLNLSYNFSGNKVFEDFREHAVNGRLRYGFSNKLWGGEIGYNYLYDPKKFSKLGINVKSIVEQFNQQEPILPLVNSLYTLFGNDNYMKLYKETAVEGSFFTELINGVFFNSVVKYAQRDPLKNSSDVLFIDDKSKLFTSNNPLNPSDDALSFSSNNALTAEVSFSFRFKQKYITVPGKKIISGSKYPQLTISYKKAIPVLGAIADYDLASASVFDRINLGLFGRFNYRVSGGVFLRSENLMFTDYKHFLGNQTIFSTNNYLSSFRLLPYYTYSASEWFTEAHAEQHFRGFIFNKIPLLKKTNLQEVVGGHFLMSNALKHYYEINFGIDRILGIIRVDYILGYGINNKVRNGFTISINRRF